MHVLTFMHLSLLCILLAATFMEPEVTTTENPEEPLDITCPSSCEGLEPGPYQSCASCNQYMMCLDGGIMLDGIFCDGNLEWDDKEKACVGKSSTCPNPPLTTAYYPEEYTTILPEESKCIHMYQFPWKPEKVNHMICYHSCIMCVAIKLLLLLLYYCI